MNRGDACFKYENALETLHEGYYWWEMRLIDGNVRLSGWAILIAIVVSIAAFIHSFS